MFAIGAFLPLLPWLVGSGASAVLASIVIAVIAALTLGALLAQLSGKSRIFGAFRALAIGALAAGVTYGVGHLVGMSTA